VDVQGLFLIWVGIGDSHGLQVDLVVHVAWSKEIHLSTVARNLSLVLKHNLTGHIHVRLLSLLEPGHDVRQTDLLHPVVCPLC